MQKIKIKLFSTAGFSEQKLIVALFSQHFKLFHILEQHAKAQKEILLFSLRNLLSLWNGFDDDKTKTKKLS